MGRIFAMSIIIEKYHGLGNDYFIYDPNKNELALTEERIKACHDMGVEVNCWTVDKPEEAEKLKKFLSNKNTVTVVGIVVAIFVLYFAYNWRVNQATNPVTVPYARTQISPGTQITESMVGTRQVPPSMLQGDVVRSASEVIDKYSNADTLIPAGSLFYQRQVVEKEQLPANIILSYPNGYVPYR